LVRFLILEMEQIEYGFPAGDSVPEGVEAARI
jgi:hypothetical protein